MTRYWTFLFHCDYLIYFFDILDNSGKIQQHPKAIVLSKLIPPIWNPDLFSFTQTYSSWNESNTVKYNGVSIGEFQVHTNRDCFKFRFNMEGILKLIESGSLEIPEQQN